MRVPDALFDHIRRISSNIERIGIFAASRDVRNDGRDTAGKLGSLRLLATSGCLCVESTDEQCASRFRQPMF
jgi:hypothetical protein